jgi:hypothetical protein
VTRAPALVVIIIIFFLELRCVALLYVAVSYYLSFVLSLLLADAGALRRSC